MKLNVNELKIQNNSFLNFNGEFSVFRNLKKGVFKIKIIEIFLLKKNSILKKNDL
jgi:hypothetical protein